MTEGLPEAEPEELELLPLAAGVAAAEEETRGFNEPKSSSRKSGLLMTSSWSLWKLRESRNLPEMESMEGSNECLLKCDILQKAKSK